MLKTEYNLLQQRLHLESCVMLPAPHNALVGVTNASKRCKNVEDAEKQR